MKSSICKKIAVLLMSFAFCFSAYAEQMTLNSIEMQELIKEFRQEIQRYPTIMRAPLVNDYIQHVGTKLSRHAADRAIHYTFYVNQAVDINAFAGPGGIIVINSGLILTTNKEDELAGVLAHEIAHAEQKHWLSDINRQNNMRVPMIASMLAAIALGVISPALGSGAMMGGMSGFAQNEINYTRSHEKEADRIGIQLLYTAGYNPQGMVDFLRKMQKQNQYHDMAAIPAILLTHPLDDVRIADAENRVLHLPKKHYVVSPDYAIVKEIVRVLTTKKTSTLLPFYRENLQKKPNNAALQYGEALVLMKMLKFSAAKAKLQVLVKQSPHNYYYVLALSGCEIGLKNFTQAEKLLQALYERYPDNLAIIIDYASGLIHLNKLQKAEQIINNGLDDYANNTLLLEKLAIVQAKNHQTAQAYLTRAIMFLQEGQTQQAGIALQSAKKTAGNDPRLRAQINAQMQILRTLKKLENQ